MEYTNNCCTSTFQVIKKDGKFFVRHSFKGTNFSSTDDMKVYGLDKAPYVKRLGEKMFLTQELLAELATV